MQPVLSSNTGLDTKRSNSVGQWVTGEKSTWTNGLIEVNGIEMKVDGNLEMGWVVREMVVKDGAEGRIKLAIKL